MNDILYSLIGAGVAGAFVGGFLIYLIMKSKIKTCEEDIRAAKRYIKKLESIDYKKEYIKKNSVKEETKEPTSPLPKDDNIFKDLNRNKDFDNRESISMAMQSRTETAPNYQTSRESATLDDLKSLSKVVEEVESLSLGGDILPSINSVEQYSDEVLESETNSGSLPVVREHFRDNPNIKRDDFKKFAGVKVLVAEDNPVNSKLIDILFDKTGVDIEIAEDGVTAVSKLRDAFLHSEPYDLVLMDVHMPKMNGLEATRVIREDPDLVNTPVIALTASTDKDEIAAILDSGMNGYLNKPIKLGKVYSAFNIFLKDIDKKQNSSATQQKDSISDTPVLNMSTGIKHSNGDEALYNSLLLDFTNNYSDSANKFKKYVTRGDLIALKSLVIDLEGLSGTLGADELYQITKEINQSLQEHNGMEKMIKYIPRFKKVIERLNETIKSRVAS